MRHSPFESQLSSTAVFGVLPKLRRPPYTKWVRNLLACLVTGIGLWCMPCFGDEAKPTSEGHDAHDDTGGFGAFPIVGYSPETSAMLGGVVVYHFDSPGERAGNEAKPKRSSLQWVGFYTYKRQYVLALAPTVYLGHNWRFSGEAALVYFPDTYFPQGPNSPESAAEDFTQRTLLGELNVERRLFSHLSMGFNLVALNWQMLKVEPGAALDSGQVLGATGGPLYAAGPSVIWDSRERDYAARFGARHQLRWRVAPPVLGADFAYSEAALDLRQYLRTVSDQVLALQVFGHATWHRVPFQGLASLGGDGMMRGYFARRYTDRVGVSSQLEYRLPLFWRLGGVGFAGVGSVAPSLLELRAKYLRAVAGLGLRFALNPEDGVNLRLDFGVTSEGHHNAYLQIGEAF